MVLVVKFTLTPTYRHLSKDYAPFSPFSDGGLLFHSGRFFACADECADSDNDCLNCGLCELLCPEFAICVEPLDKEVTRD